MKLLLDHNLSHKLVAKLADVYPDSTQTRLLNFGRSGDSELWFYARTHVNGGADYFVVGVYGRTLGTHRPTFRRYSS